MKNAFLAVSFVSLSLFSSLGLFATTASAKTSLIEADLRCEQPGGGLAIQMPTPSAAARVWQTDVGEADGLELEVTKFEVQRCPLCFSFTATLFDTPVRGEVVSGVLKYEIYSEDEKAWSLLLENVPCKAVKP